MKFYAIAIEQPTAQSLGGYSIGVAKFQERYLEGTWGCSLDFGDESEPGADLGSAHVRRMPRFVDVVAELFRYVDAGAVVHFAPHSRLLIEHGAYSHKIPLPDWTWLSSLSLSRRSWPELLKRCSDLHFLARELGIGSKPGDAVEQAVATGIIALEAAKRLDLDFPRLFQMAVIPRLAR